MRSRGVRRGAGGDHRGEGGLGGRGSDPGDRVGEQAHGEALAQSVEDRGTYAVVGGDAGDVEVGDAVVAQPAGEIGVPVTGGDPLEAAVGGVRHPLAEDLVEVRQSRLERGVELRARGVGGAVHRPGRRVVGLAVDRPVLARVVVPVGGGHDGGVVAVPEVVPLPVVEHAFSRPCGDRGSTGDGEGAPFAEVVLDATRGYVPVCRQGAGVAPGAGAEVTLYVYEYKCASHGWRVSSGGASEPPMHGHTEGRVDRGRVVMDTSTFVVSVVSAGIAALFTHLAALHRARVEVRRTRGLDAANAFIQAATLLKHTVVSDGDYDSLILPISDMEAAGRLIQIYFPHHVTEAALEAERCTFELFEAAADGAPVEEQQRLMLQTSESVEFFTWATHKHLRIKQPKERSRFMR